MANFTVSYFILGVWPHFGPLKYLYFTIIALLYIAVVFSNTALLVVIYMNRSLHEPMYLFLCSLFVKELYRSAAIFPFVLSQMISDTHTVSVPYCYLTMFCFYTYAVIEFLTLALMSYDRYLAICHPLQYNTRMTSNKVAVFIVVAWLFASLLVLINLSLSRRLTLCGNYINNWWCENYLIVLLACSRSDTRVNNIWGLFITVLGVLVPLIPILFSYMKILQVCFVGSKETRQKALSTCAPQVVSLLCYSFACCFVIGLSRVDRSSWPRVLNDFLNVYADLWANVVMLLNPIMFGMGLSKIRNICKSLVYSYILTGSRVPGV